MLTLCVNFDMCLLPQRFTCVVTYKFFMITLQHIFKVKTFNKHKLNMSNNDVHFDNTEKLASAVYLQVSTISQALIFVTRSRSWSFLERPGLLLIIAFVIAQLVSYLIGRIEIYKWEQLKTVKTNLLVRLPPYKLRVV